MIIIDFSFIKRFLQNNFGKKSKNKKLENTKLIILQISKLFIIEYCFFYILKTEIIIHCTRCIYYDCILFLISRFRGVIDKEPDYKTGSSSSHATTFTFRSIPLRKA